MSDSNYSAGTDCSRAASARAEQDAATNHA